MKKEVAQQIGSSSRVQQKIVNTNYPNTLVMLNNVFGEFRDMHPDFEVEIRVCLQTGAARRLQQYEYAFSNRRSDTSRESVGFRAYSAHPRTRTLR